MLDDVSERKRTLMYSLPQTIGFFSRELVAVALILLLEQRVAAYDLLNYGFVMLLVLITFRTPYINSYAFFFEISSIGKWSVSHHVGLQKHANFTQNLFLFIAVLAGHIGGAIGAAALRVLIDVTYGTESMGSAQNLELGVDVGSLLSVDTFWGSEKRLERLALAGLMNGTRTISLPISDDINVLGLDSAAVALWYLLEEVGYVSLLCMCYLHIWLGAGLAKDEMKALEPFKSEFWKRLFRMSFLLTIVNMALNRCFPTAHGSLHNTVYKCQYQAWSPDQHLVDNDNQEPLIRVLGGLIGVVVGYSYNKILVATRDNKDDEGFYYRLVWGREPVRDDGRVAVKNPTANPRYARGGGRYAKVVKGDDQAYDPADCEIHTICVTQGRCKKHAGGVGCTAECKNAVEAEGGNFKLRIPFTLDHPK